MNRNPLNPAVICFGEILWDNLPTGRNPGGAPMNVAYHLNKLGVRTALISAVGQDVAGTDLLGFLADKGVSSEFVQVDPGHKTSEVTASVSADHEVTYEILPDVAWDYIALDESSKKAASHAAAFVYGSLSSRNHTSRATLLALLSASSYNVFDVNLRAPHYTPDLIKRLMQHASLLKVNAAELGLIAEWHGCRSEHEAQVVEELLRQYKTEGIVITKGSAGASFYSRNEHFERPAYKVQVQDTIGSGDSFLAAFLAKKLNGSAIDEALGYAIAMGGFITSKSGACPIYEKGDFETFKEHARPTN